MGLLLAFSACTDGISEVQFTSTLKQIVMIASDFETEDGSRTSFQITDTGAEFSWAANDTVGIFPNEGAQAYFSMTSGAGTKTAKFDGGGWALKDASVYAAYYPFIGDFYLNKNAIPVDYTGQVQTGDASTAHLGAYDFMAAIPAVPKNGSVNFAFKHLGALVQLKLTMPEPTTIHSISLVTESEAFSLKGKMNIMASNPCIASTITSKNLSLQVKDVVTTEANQVVTLYLMLPPADLSSQKLKAVVSTSQGSKEVALESRNFLAGKAYALTGIAGEITNEDTYDAVINENTKIIDNEFVSFVTNTVDASTIVMSTKTPPEILPIVGDIILCGVEHEKFPYGFVGKVSQVKQESVGYIIETEQPELGEIFDFISLEGEGGLELIPQTESRASDIICSIKKEEFELTAKSYEDSENFKGTSIDLTINLEKNKEFSSGNMEGELNASSKIHLGGDLGFRYDFKLSENVKGKADNFYFNVDILQKAKFDVTLGLEGNINFINKLAELTFKPIKVNLGNCLKKTKNDSRIAPAVTKVIFVLLQPQLSLNYRTNAMGKIDTQFGVSSSETTHFTIQNKQCKLETSEGADVETVFAKANMEGSLKTGLDFEFTIKPIWRTTKNENLVEVGFYAGPQISGVAEAGYGAENNICFEVVPLDMNLSGQVTVYPFLKKDAQPQINLSASQNWKFGEQKRWLFPHYEKLKANFIIENEPNIFTSAILKDSTILPVKVGFSLYDKDENYIKSSTEFKEYHFPAPKEFVLQDEFSDIDTTKTYYVKPTIEWLEKRVEYDQKILVGEKDELREALIKLYESTNGDNWICNDNWCSDKPVEEWYGVKLIENREIVSDGMIFTAFKGEYYVDLSDNNLVGQINQDFPNDVIIHLNISNNKLTSLNISEYTSLKSLGCFNNLLTSLDVSRCTDLERLYCTNNFLKSLDVLGCINLKTLSCSTNRLTSLDVLECKALESLLCEDNLLTSLDLSGLTALWLLSCGNNQLTSLDVSGNTTLESLSCSTNKLVALDISDCIALRSLGCGQNELTSLNLSGYTNLKELYCVENQMVSLDLSGCMSLTHVQCYSNQLTSLNVSECVSLEYMNCYNNKLISLDVSECVNLNILYCNSNHLTFLNISNCQDLEWLVCYDNQLTSLDVSGFAALTYLFCYNNQLVSLNASGCITLKDLRCYDNRLTSLDASGCTALEILYCENNQIVLFNISGCTSLKHLVCKNNKIKSEIPEWLYKVLHHSIAFSHDQRYEYSRVFENGKYVVKYKDKGVGWWYPGEPESKSHTPPVYW